MQFQLDLLKDCSKRTEFFSKSSDEVIKKGNKADEMMSGSASKNIDDITIATKDQELIINKIGDDVHSSHLRDQ